ncbi:MAG TPA: DUF1080 domain-containing protein [Candidatus Solibacter sp.]|nr:DUF1080 domain-containing protein [Candidatus Solibacter sp.]
MKTQLLICAMVAVTALAQEPKWTPIFDGKTLKGWKETPFTGKGSVKVEDGAIILGAGSPMTGINWDGEFPKANYEIRMEAARLQGNDFFAGITFPVFHTFCSWINGGWNGEVVGLSSLDGYDASENETSQRVKFEKGRWYKLRLQVTAERIAAWIDDQLTFEFAVGSREVGLRAGEIELSKPFGIAAYRTQAGVRRIEYRVLE